jgi:methylmalonyl-CoA mutase N-terminal domain/subunit
MIRRMERGWRTAARAELPAGAAIVDPSLTAVAQVAAVIAAGVRCAPAVLIATGTNFLEEIAKLRAARALWVQVCANPMQLWVTTPERASTDPDMDLLRATTEALSAVLGGCDVLVIGKAGFGAHLAESLGRILLEEAHLHHVADPAGGAYHVESLTASMIEEAWKHHAGPVIEAAPTPAAAGDPWLSPQGLAIKPV